MSLAAQSKYYAPRDRCKFHEDMDYDNNTGVTFYGDSRGHYVSMPFYGEAQEGWIPYFKSGKAVDMGIHHLHLHSYIGNQADCSVGACWTANPVYFRDLIHPNWIGYAVLGQQIGKWMGEQGWNKADEYTPVALTEAEGLRQISLIIAKAKVIGANIVSETRVHVSVTGTTGRCADANIPNSIVFLDPIRVTICAYKDVASANFTVGDIRGYYLGKGGTSWFGFALTDEMVRGTAGIDRCQNFEKGYIYWSPIHGIRNVVPDQACP